MQTIEELWKLLENVELVQVHPVEMEALYKHCFEFKNPKIVEVGSAHGASSIVLAEAAKELSGQLDCVDSYPENYYDQEKFGRYALEAFNKNMADYLLDGIAKLWAMTSDKAVEFGLKQEIDVLFIDGGHEYDEVYQDIASLIPYLKPGGYIAFDDYHNVAFHGVKEAVDFMLGDWPVAEDVWNFRILRKP